MRRIPRLAAATAAAAALTVLAGGPASAVDPTVTDPHIVAHFDFAAGETPENIALEPDGSADITLAFAHKVVRVAKDGTKTPVAELPTVANPQTPNLGAALALGIARAHDGTLYVAYATGTAETGIWRIAPGGGAPRQIAQLPADAFPNGIALDEHCDTLYAADSNRGEVWSIPLDGGDPFVWASGPELAPSPQLPFGANGLKLHDGAVWVSNTAQSTLLRIPFEEDRSAGPIETRATGLTGIDDFTFAGHDDTVLAALNTVNKLELVRPDGTHKTVLTEADGLDNPTSAAVRAKTLYVNSAAFFDTVAPDPNLLLARISRNKL
ncbi:hypothetical protein [Streptomyces vietnamensis]|uniref:SMP-30/Gluconolactonase/LRE-like region domain-containing protein n=1 Tax=Streptomyces vietnamensis TaxID=362257 RepID=A0A0B5I5F4_9ACTN|nr:hypothetical protein [Streptomyces vietnamensis]AJF65617.1 hypothetical protein SVTN_15570 [Streptomyces vietnamensis]